MNSVQFTGEYTLDRTFERGELEHLEHQLIEDLRHYSKTIKHVRNVRNERMIISREDRGGRVIMTVDVDYTFVGKILKLIGVIR